MMARPLVWLLLPLLSASGARLPGNQSRGPALSSTGAAAPWAILAEAPPPAKIAKKFPAQPAAGVGNAAVSAQIAKQPAAQVAKQPAAQLAKQPAAQVAKQPAVQVAKQPAAQIAKQPAAQIAKQPAAQVPKQPAAQVAKQAPKQPPAQISKQPAAGQISKQPAMGQLSKQPPKQPPARPGGPAGMLTAAKSVGKDIVLLVLRLLPGLPPLVAWSTDQVSTRVFRLGTGHPEWVAEADPWYIRFWPAGDRVLTVLPTITESTGAVVWNARTGRPQYVIASELIYAAELSAGGDRLTTIGSGTVVGDREVVVRDAASGEVLRRFDVSTSGRPSCLTMLSESTLATWGPEHEAVASVWDLASGSLRYELRQPKGSNVSLLHVSPCGAKLVTIGCDYESNYRRGVVEDWAYVWDAETGHLQGEFFAAGHHFSRARLSHDGRRVVVQTQRESGNAPPGNDDLSHVFVWDGVTGRLHRQLSLRGELLLLPCGQYIAAVNSSEASVWDVETGERLRTLEANAGLLFLLSGSRYEPRVAVSACGQLLAACKSHLLPRSFLADRIVVFAVWHVRSGRLLLEEVLPLEVLDGRDSHCDIAVGNLATMADELLR